MLKSLNLKASLVSLLLLLVFLAAWHIATLPVSSAAVSPAVSAERAEYLRMLGKDPGTAKASGFPTPLQLGQTAWTQLSNPFYDNGPNDKGIGIQLGHSLARVGLGFFLACIVAIPLGFLIGMSPLMRRAPPWRQPGALSMAPFRSSSTSTAN